MKLDDKLNFAIGSFERVKCYSTARLAKSVKYGDDMKSSRIVCFEDHLSLLKKYISDMEILLSEMKKDANYICSFEFEE